MQDITTYKNFNLAKRAICSFYYFTFAGYISKPNTQCDSVITKYATLIQAQKACLADNKCTAVTDFSCDGSHFWTCDDENSLSSRPSFRSCSWLKGIQLGI